MNWDYIAGWFDGEGTVHHSKQKRHYLLSFPNTDLDVITEMLKFLKKYVNITCEITEYQPKQKRHYKLMYRFTITRQKEVIRVLERIKDKCVTKRKLCETAYWYEINNPILTRNKWSLDEINYLKENYKGIHGDVVKIAKHLGRTYASTENELERLKLRDKVKNANVDSAVR